MATKPAVQGPLMVVVDGRFMLPVDEAAQLLLLMTKSTIVTKEYVSGVGYVHKYSTAAAPEFSFAPLSVAQLAAMSLEG